MMHLFIAAATVWSLASAQAPQANREEFEGMMDAYVLSKLQDSLELTDEQFGRMVVAQKKLQETRREYRRERGELIRDLRRTLQTSSASEEEIGKLLARLDALESSFREDERARYGDIDALLDVRQRARYRILEVEIQRRLQELIRQVRQNRQRP